MTNPTGPRTTPRAPRRRHRRQPLQRRLAFVRRDVRVICDRRRCGGTGVLSGGQPGRQLVAIRGHHRRSRAGRVATHPTFQPIEVTTPQRIVDGGIQRQHVGLQDGAVATGAQLQVDAQVRIESCGVQRQRPVDRSDRVRHRVHASYVDAAIAREHAAEHEAASGHIMAALITAEGGQAGVAAEPHGAGSAARRPT